MLDAFFKNYFWVVRLGVLFVAAFFVARTVNAFVGNAIAPDPQTLTKTRSARPATAKANRQRVSTEEFLKRNLFSAAREDLTEVPEAAEEAANSDGPVDMDDCDASSLGANLIATFVAEEEPESSMAVFAATGKGQEAVGLRPGEKVLDQAEIIAIQWRTVYVKNNGRCEMFSLEEEPKKKRATKAVPKVAKADTSKLGAGVEQTGDGEFSIPRSEIDNVLSNLNKVATQARIVPSFHNGKANGFKLFSIRPNSLYSKIGIQNGDIVQRINGYEITSPDKALEIYSKLKDAQSISVDLVRRGKSKSLSYNIR